jgi:hypothetical protein
MPDPRVSFHGGLLSPGRAGGRERQLLDLSYIHHSAGGHKRHTFTLQSSPAAR